MVIPLLTTASGPGYSDTQPTPSHSLGGFASTTRYAGGALYDLFGRASSVDVADARADYRALYVWNDDQTNTLTDLRVYVTPVTSGATNLYVGVDPYPVTYYDQLSAQGSEILSAYSAPSGVTFGPTSDYTTAAVIGDLPPNTGRIVWIRRVPQGAAGSALDAADITFEDADGGATVRRISWETEPYSDRTAPVRAPIYVATPSPITRLNVDYLTEGGARVTWEIDRSLVDSGPYTFQLQQSHGGGTASDEWTDIGPPAVDPPYLIDSDKRLWGQSITLRYRVILTTGEATYASPPVNADGNLSRQQWLEVREILRKETLMLRGFTGVNGFLLKAKRYGTRCSCVNTDSREVMNSSHLLCYGTGYIGGYHPPVASFFANTDPTTTKERVAYNEDRGTTKPVTTWARMTGTLPLVHKDAFVAIGSDDRYYIHTVKEAATRVGVPIVYMVELRLAPRSDILYTVEVTRPTYPTPYWQTPVTITV